MSSNSYYISRES